MITAADSFLVSAGSLFLRSIALLTLTGFAYLLCRKKSAAVRHRILLMGIIGLGLLPLLLFVPALHLNIGGTLPVIKGKSFSPLVPQQLKAPVFAPIVDQSGASDVHPREQALIVTVPPVRESPGRTPTPATAEPVIANPVNVAASPNVSPNISEWVLGIWIFGVVILFARLIAAHSAAWKLTSTSSAPTQLLALCDGKELAGTRVLASEKIDMPMTWGLRPATILLPTEAVNTWGPNRLNAVLLHETAHVRRSDWLSQLLSEVILAVYWPNPLIWFCCRRLRLEAELACDDRVLSTGLAPSEYASELIECVRQARRKLSVGAAAVAMADKNAVSARVKAALDTTKSRTSLHRRGAMAAALAGLALTVVIGAIWSNGAKVFGDNPSTPWTQVLTNGTTVQLVGIASGPKSGDYSFPVPYNKFGIVPNPLIGTDTEWWSPDGKVIADPSIDGTGFTVPAMDMRRETGTTIRYLYFRVTSAQGAHNVDTLGSLATSTEADLKNLFSGERPLAVNLTLPPQTPVSGIVPTAFSCPVKSFGYRFAVAVGPAQILSSIPNTPAAGASQADLAKYKDFPAQLIIFKKKAAVYIQSMGKISPLFPFDVGRANSSDLASEFSAVDSEGNSVQIGPWYTVKGGALQAFILPSELKKISKFELISQKYEWADFENIPYAPPAPEPGVLYTRTLSNGITAGLVGVTSDVLGGNSEGWWAADGTPIGDPSEDGPSFAKASHNYGDQYVRRYVCLTISSAKAMNNVTVARMITKPHVSVAGSDGELDIVPGVSLEPNVRLWGKFPVAFNGPTDQFNYKFGIASGPWHTTAVKANTLISSLSTAIPAGWSGPYVTVTAGQRSGVQLLEENDSRNHVRSLGEGIAFDTPGNPGELVDRKVVALDAQGNIVPLTGWSPVPGNSSFANIPIAAFRRITKFELQTRPFVWAEFGNIRSAPVVPKGTYSVTNDIPIPPALPGFSKTLPDGSNIS
jgi:beta-lactamase regulating signal transducer with metallopeptidase domain